MGVNLTIIFIHYEVRECSVKVCGFSPCLDWEVRWESVSMYTKGVYNHNISFQSGDWSTVAHHNLAALGRCNGMCGYRTLWSKGGRLLYLQELQMY